MKRWNRILGLVLTAVMLLYGTGCTRGQENVDGEGIEILLYYETKDVEQMASETSVAAESRKVNVLSLWEFFDLYFSGPVSENLVSPFPHGTRVLDVETSDQTMTLKMSGEYFTLMGVEMSIANCCLANTVCAYFNLESVTLMDETESIQLEAKPGQYVLSNSLQDDMTETFVVYFADSEYRYLNSETRDATLSENETEMAYVMRKLLEGPENEQLKPIIPEGAEILGISSSEGICTVNFSHEFYENRLDDTYGAYMTIYGITNTLTGLDGIEAVQFLVEGEAVDHYGLFPLGQPVTRNSDCIGPVRMASGEVDVNIYVLSAENQEPFAIPCRVKQTVSQPLAEAVVTKILSYEPPQGFVNPIPYGTELLSISVSGNVCYVDLSDKFIPQEDTEATEKAAVWALTKSLTVLDNITSIVLTINGENDGLNYVDISEPLTEESVSLD